MKRTKLRTHSKSERSKYIRLLDYMFLTYIVIRDKTCTFCGKDAYTGHHIFAKGRCGNVRYDPVNAAGVCWYCHKYKTHTNPEMHRQTIIKFVDSLHGKGAYERLTARAYLKGNLKMPDLFIIEMDLSDLLNFKRSEWLLKSYSAKMESLKEMRKGAR